jgi:hypothetical protein
MTFNVIAHVWRKPGTTMEHFVDYYENKHIPLVYELAGSKFPLHHIRHYVQRNSPDHAITTGGELSNLETFATLFKDKPDGVDYDVMVEMAFEDKAAFEAFIGVFANPEAGAKLAEDEANFVDGSKTSIFLESHSATSKRK